MPTRLLREGILSSDRVELLDPPAEVFYRRLMSKVDDHGLYDARPSVLRASLYPLRIDRVREADISRWIAACEKAGLIVLYEADRKPYLMLLNTGWEKRSKAKYPLPPENICAQPLTPAPVVVVEVEVESVVVGEGPRKRGTPAPKRKPKTEMPEGFGVSDRVKRWAAEKHHDRLEQHLEAFRRRVRQHDYRYVDWDEAFMTAIADNWAKLPAVNGHNHAKPWFIAGWSALVEKGAEKGLAEGEFDSPPAFRAAVLKAHGISDEDVRKAEADWKVAA
jgi:hypothetical protein